MSKAKVEARVRGVAVIGMAGRFPGARNVAEFWHNLRDGVEGISFFTAQELEASGISTAQLNAPNYVRAKGVLEDGDKFDAAFFGFSPREAELMDPQHRVFMECVWEALESAGYDPEKYDGTIGLYGGLSMNTYLLFNLLTNRSLIESAGFLQTSIQNRTDHLTTHVAYELNLTGPCVTVQTACSTSLVAVHLATQSLLSGECEMIVAGGVSVSAPLKKGYTYQEGGIFSSDGHCRAFDASAQGTVDGDGVGAVVLKRLEDAIDDGDTILAVINGSAINNDGSQKVGYTAPGSHGQAEVIAEAQAVADVEADTVTYIETHGTGTTLGDPIEIEALTQAFRQSTGRNGFCAIGSVKSNIGHLDAAAGVTGLIKTVLALKHKELPPSLHFERPNPRIDFENSPFFVNNRRAAWTAQDTPRRAGVSSFGIGGTNAHVVLEEAPASESVESSRSWHLLPLSAKSSAALDVATLNLIEHLRHHPEINIADVALTLQRGRREFDHRRVAVCHSVEDAVQTLETLDYRRAFTGLQEPQERQITMMFPGQGAQYANMGAGLYQTEPSFRKIVDRCCQFLRPELGFALQDVLFPRAENVERAAAQLKQTHITQPALFVIEYALAKLWMSWGIEPAAMIGHSIGEYVAACVAGVFSLEDALRLVAARGRLMQSLPGGAMLVVPSPEAEVRSLFKSGDLSLAAVNAPSLCVVAGTNDAIDELEHELKGRGATCRRLHTSHAFHSAMMEPILEEFASLVRKVTLSAPQIPYLSNVTGNWITDAEATDPAYWAKHLRQTVRFNDGANVLFKDAERVLLEVGPGRVLSTLMRQHPFKGAARVVLSSLPHADERDSADAFMLATLGRLWLTGAKVDWSELYHDERRRRVALPTYPFERRRFWVEARPADSSSGSAEDALRKKSDVADWFYSPSWKRSLNHVGAPPQTPTQSHKWLFFVDDSWLGTELATALRAAGGEAAQVKAGEHFARTGEREFIINPRRREDYDELLENLRVHGNAPQGIVHLWAVTPEGVEASDVESRERLLDRSFYSLLLLSQALGNTQSAGPVRLFVITNDMQEVSGDENLIPEKATVLGPCRVIPQEYENISCQSIDVTLPQQSQPAAARLIEQLLAELGGVEVEDAVIAYRGAHRWSQTFEPFGLEASHEIAPRLRKGGVYLLTGGLGGMALELAEYLGRTVQASLVLVARSEFPEEKLWDDWLATHGEQDATSRRIRKVQSLKALGAHVLVVTADVANAEQFGAAVETARRHFGRIDGVIHTAGVAGGGIIQLKTLESAAAVLAPKVAGTRVLETTFKDDALDFLILCSSRSAILGGFGQIDYCAANAYLDAFAHYHAARSGSFVVSIDWDAWQAVGMLAHASAQFDRKEQPDDSLTERTAHPLIEKVVARLPGRETFSTEVCPSTHWVLDDHRIVGAAIMPGTAYLEMARAALETHAEKGDVEIQDAFFLQPLGLRDSERREVRTVLEKVVNGFEFRILSNASHADGNDAGEWQQYSIGTIRHIAPELPKRHDLRAIMERCREREVVITDEHEFDPDLGPRWQSLRRVMLGHNELLALLELPEEFASDMEQLKMHPALLDRATGTAKHYLVNQGHYLPMSYKRLRLRAALPRKIYTYIKYRESDSPTHETITFDIFITDEHGLECIDIEGFSQKRVNNTAEPIRMMGGVKESAAERSIAAGSAISAGEHEESLYRQNMAEGLTPQEGVEAFKRILAADVAPQVIVSTKDLQASIARAKSLTQKQITEEIEKLDVSRPTHPRPNMMTAYAAPGNETERALAEIMQSILGIEQVGIHDSFFDLGGDSVLGIQIIAKANRIGLQITPQEIFQHQTIAELAIVARKSEVLKAEQGEVTGEVPLTPIQHWFMKRHLPAPHHSNQSMLVEARASVNPSLLEKALAQVVSHHDALRMRFEKSETGWRQFNDASRESLPFERVDLSSMKEAERITYIEARMKDVGASFDLSQGPLIRFIYFDGGAGAPSRLLVCAHQLIADETSWRMLLEDLETAYRQYERGIAVALPAKTSSFKQWAEQLVKQAEVTAIKDEAGYWTGEALRHASSIPHDYLNGINTEESKQRVNVTLGVEETKVLKDDVAQVYHTQFSDVLLTALAQSVNRWCGADAVAVSLEAPGRAGMLEGLNLTRTIGNFNSFFPVVLHVSAGGDAGETLKSIKEQLRAVPNWGFGYGLLAHLTQDTAIRETLEAISQPDILFSLRQDTEEILSASALFAPATLETQTDVGLSNTRSHLLEIRASEVEGSLHVEWTYSTNVHQRTTVEMLAQSYLEALRSLIAHCQSPDAGGYTPSDFPLASLDRDKLSKLPMLIDAESDDEDGDLTDGQTGGVEEVAGMLRLHPSVREAVVVPLEMGNAQPDLVAYVVINENEAQRTKMRTMDFSLFFFADASAASSSNKYHLYLEGAKFADRHGFSAVWTPERHFHVNGGLYPSPTVLNGALAAITNNIQLRAGSVVLPLHNSLRVAEEWSIIDNLSNGRTGVSFTSGWIPNDFAFYPERFPRKREEMFRGIREVQQLWRGNPLIMRDGAGNNVELRIFPEPVQASLPIWLTCSGDPEMFVKAGELGLNVLTALLSQSIEETAGKIKLYRESLARHGHDPEAGRVTLMMHTFVGDNMEDVLQKVRAPLSDYLRSHVGLVETMVQSLNIDVGINREEYLDHLIAFAFERYYQTASLIGTPAKCLKTVEHLKTLGVDEVACFIDFGVEGEAVLQHLQHLNTLRELSNNSPLPPAQNGGRDAGINSLGEFVKDKLPANLIPVDFIELNALPRTPGGNIDYQSLPVPGRLRNK